MMLKGKRGTSSESGVSLVMVGLSMSVLATLSVSMLIAIRSTSSEKSAQREEVAALFAAEAGLSEAVFALNSGGSANLGSQQQPMSIAESTFWVTETNLANGMKSLVATGVDNRAGSRIELTVRQDQDNIWVWGAFGDEELTMDSNSHVDSYDSTLGTYVLQQVNGSGSGYALSSGNVGSNGDIDLSSNAAVNGNATCGPTSTTTVTGNATVSGSTAPNTGTVSMPALTMPSFGSSGNFSYGGSSVVIPSGDYEYDDFMVDGNDTVTIVGPATLVVDNLEMDSNAELWVDATNGPVSIYVWNDFILNSNTSVASTTFTPADLQINLASDNIINPTQNIQLAEVALQSNSVLYGTIYAPNAQIDVDSNFELFGAVVARQVHLDSNAFVHFDEALLDASNNSSGATWEAVCWRRLAFQP